MDKYSKILIFRQGRIGDTLVTFPVIEALNQLYPETPIDYCTQYLNKDDHLQGHDVIKLSPHIRNVITYNVRDSAYNKYLKLKSKLNTKNDELLIYLPYSRVKRYQVLRDWIFFKALGFNNMICFKETWKWTYIYEKKKTELPKESDRMLSFLRSAGISIEFPKTCSVICNSIWGEHKWSEWGLNNKSVLAISPGSRMQSKRWPIERFIEVGREWHKRTNMSLVIIGGPAETEIAKEIISYWPGYGFSACDATLSQTAALLLRVKAYCGNDTGSMHLAALLGIPCVAIFSARAPVKLWYPMGEGHIVLREEVNCSNCNLDNCYSEPSLCLDRISVDCVLDALSKIK